jgi:endogenous inhibitor of DNA gyrase (YacG/DUF329 family)
MSPPKVKCPTCRKSGPWLAGGFAPFCSQRCKLIDLGKWLNAEHAISEPLRIEHLEKLPGPSAGESAATPDGSVKS